MYITVWPSSCEVGKTCFLIFISHKSYSELERSLEEKIRTLQNQLETEQVECRRLVWANSDAVKERQLEVQRYKRVCDTTWCCCDLSSYKVWKLSILVDHGYEFQKKRENNGEFALNFPNQSCEALLYLSGASLLLHLTRNLITCNIKWAQP